MAFIRAKIIKGVNYYYLVENKRIDGKVKQKILQYFGTTLPDVYSMVKKSIVVPTVKRHAVVAKEAVQRVSPTKTKGNIEPSKVSTTDKIPVSTTKTKTHDNPVATTVDVQIALQRRAAVNNMTAEAYLAKLLGTHHGVSRKTGKRY